MQYDITIIGSGPGGYVAAIRGAQLGLNVAIVEKYNSLGGTCLNVGCIPSKALLDSSHHYHSATHDFEAHGISMTSLKIDLKKMIQRKNDVVNQTCSGIDYLMKKNKITVLHGTGSIQSKNKVSVKLNNGKIQTVSTVNIIIATGSKPMIPNSFNYDKKRVISSTEALNIDKLPKKMIVIGAGVIGLELGSVFARLGTEVQVIEYQKGILPGMDKDLTKALRRDLKKLGIKFHLSHMVTDVNATKTKVKVRAKKRDSEEELVLEADYCLVAIGRKPFTEGLGLANIGVMIDERGIIDVDEHLQTNVEGIYAIGDVIKGPMLAHKAEEEGVFVVEHLAGQKPHIDYNLIPGVVYTWPELATVGQTEDELKESGRAYNAGKFPYKALGRARASMDLSGMVKVLSDKETDEILGVHILGARAADMIMEAVALMEFRASAEDMAMICHPHPTFTEAVKEAALGASGKGYIHI